MEDEAERGAKKKNKTGPSKASVCVCDVAGAEKRVKLRNVCACSYDRIYTRVQQSDRTDKPFFCCNLSRPQTTK